ncbi:MAG: hypothetical protein JRI23_07100, partial [Deltaproteobacteria bacterium]|nr:hypothetical protein [Deltaproteobacteria bacterium]MBW2531359.1 hypothetical protein [Deltaproteobacteria bacterium]
MELKEIAQEVEQLEPRLERLRSLYEQYFMGLEKIEPGTVRREVDRKFWQLRKLRIQNTALRFRLQMLIQRYNTYQQYWARVMREMERGTYRRDVLRAAKRVGKTEAMTILGKRRAQMFEKLAAAQEERLGRAADATAEQEQDLLEVEQQMADGTAIAEEALQAAIQAYEDPHAQQQYPEHYADPNAPQQYPGHYADPNGPQQYGAQYADPSAQQQYAAQYADPSAQRHAAQYGEAYADPHAQQQYAAQYGEAYADPHASQQHAAQYGEAYAQPPPSQQHAPTLDTSNWAAEALVDDAPTVPPPAPAQPVRFEAPAPSPVPAAVVTAETAPTPAASALSPSPVSLEDPSAWGLTDD